MFRRYLLRNTVRENIFTKSLTLKMSNSFKIKSSKNIPYFDLYAAEVSFLEATKKPKEILSFTEQCSLQCKAGAVNVIIVLKIAQVLSSKLRVIILQPSLY